MQPCEDHPANVGWLLTIACLLPAAVASAGQRSEQRAAAGVSNDLSSVFLQRPRLLPPLRAPLA
jgi:hypothetical protein